MAIIRQGEIVASCVPQQAMEQLEGSVWEGTVQQEKVAALRVDYKVISSQMFRGQPRLRVISKAARPSEEFTAVTPTLEDYYLDQVTLSDH
jgi:hypothetical protein